MTRHLRTFNVAALAATVLTALLSIPVAHSAEAPEQVAPPEVAQRSDGADAASGQLVVVEARPDATPQAVTDALSDAGLVAVDTPAAGNHILARSIEGDSARTAADAVAADTSAIAGAEAAQMVFQLADAPNDVMFRYQWNLNKIQTLDAWDVNRGDGAVVAIVDGGIARSAPDLATTRFVAGYDFVDNDTNPYSLDSHGTHVAAIVAQGTNNAIGGAGIAPNASIMPLRMFNDEGAGTDHGAAAAIRWAVDHGADVINLSLGMANSSSVLLSAVTYAETNGVTLVAAAGNRSSTVMYPAAYPTVLAVGATDIGDNRAEYSSAGPELDVVAPGGDGRYDRNGDGQADAILAQTITADGSESYCFCQKQGTSMASPHVAAAVAMLASAGVTDPMRVRTAITETAKDVGAAGFDNGTGHGLLQARAALDYATGGTTAPPATTPTTPPVSAPGAYSPRLLINACPLDAPTVTFDDVNPASTHARAISCVAGAGLANGTGAGRYSPDVSVTRAQMATFLARLLEEVHVTLPSAPPDAFGDDNGNSHELRINQLAALGIIRGTSDGRYNPSGQVTRAAMASFLNRTYDRAATVPLPPAGDQFGDDNGNTHEASINKVAAAGIAAGTSLGRYSPSLNVTRAQMATFVARTLDRIMWAADHQTPDE